MAGFGVRIDYAIGSFAESVEAKVRPVGNAVSKAVKQAGLEAKTAGRASIAAAGFSARWQNTLRADFYENEKIDAASVLYHKIPYAGVFDKRTVITGKPLMWIALPQTRKLLGRQGKVTPAAVNAILPPGRKLYLRSGRGGKLILFANLEVGTASGITTIAKLSAKQLVSGRVGRGKARRVVAVPLFVAERSVTIDKKFAVVEAADAAELRLATLYAENLKGEL